VFFREKIVFDKENTRIRQVIGEWSCADLKNKTLFLDNISGLLTKVQGFRGTICKILEKDYLIKKILGEQLTEINEAEESFSKLKEKLVY